MCDQKQFISGLNKLGLSLSQQQLENILLYCQELQKWNRRVNLIARNTSSIDIVEKHFLDSLTLMPVIQQYGLEQKDHAEHTDHTTETTLLDVGTGAGFPGLVLAIALPELSVTLVEPRQKRVSFLRHIIRTLGLANVQVKDQRIEPGQGWEGPVPSFITSRAVAAADIFLPMIEVIAAEKTVVIMMGAEEISSKEKKDLHTTGWHSLEEPEFQLPFSQHPRVLTLLQKLA
uniref:16S rRNA (guanine(527)-N(7))-methyltransferase RsmG n=1 Tax=Candidatus Electrothrix sp. TaxID=2170559 RepID=UPI004056D23E